MTPALLGTKIGMTRVLTERGSIEPVTVIKAGPCTVLQVKSAETDGYEAVQLGFLDVKPHRSTKPMIGHAAKAGTGPKRHVREVRLEEPTDVSAGAVLTVDLFSNDEVQYVDVMGITKGKGFAGVMKRHGFGGLPGSHGTERKHRAPGSIGGQADRLRGRCVRRGKPMAGHMGFVRQTALSLKLLKVDTDNGLLLVRGSVPGPKGSMVVVRRSIKKG